ncbi:MAG: bifunctional adenosylcobinamide kinase/adenosylcobinamide-phosphate guanylyltransferase [Gemmatimonadaceae bacterium]|nr:bifunctional adenosylcobinamide kinase/adenosylcobinamide-phosphate guanylyltransferase [Gemmatimonadaceae bacterium]
MPPQTFRCVGCGAYWPRHWPTCNRCWRHGHIIPWSERQRAAIDSKPAASNARAVARMNWGEIEQSAYPELRLRISALVLVYGEAGAGKSSWACSLINAIKGPVCLIAAEEGLSPTLANRLQRCRIARDDFHVLTRASVDAAVEFATRIKAIAIALDSVQESAWSATELRHVLGVCPDLKLLVAVAQVNRGGLPSGPNTLRHEADVVVRVEQMRWAIDKKSRYQDPIGVGGDVLPPKEIS